MKDSTMEVGRENNRIATVEMFAVARNDGIDMNGKDLFVSHNNNVKVGLRNQTAFSGKQRFLVACIVLLLLALSVTIILLIIRESKDEKVKTKDICLTNDCVTVAAKVIQAANFSVDPCNNFYEYACGGWKAGKFLPDSKSELNGFIMLKDKIANIMKRTFSAKISYKPESALSKLIQFYRSCTNVTKLEDRAGHPLKDLLQELGSWPVLNDSWSEIGWDMENSFFKNHELLFSYIHHGRPAPFFNSYVKVDEKNSSAHIISIDQPQFKLMPKYYLKDKQAWKKVYGAYRTMMREYVALLGGNASSTQVEDMLELDIKLANATVSDDVFRDVIKTYKTMALKDFIKEVGSEFGWQKYFSMVFRGTKKVITSDTMIGSKSIEYLKKTNEILKSTSKRIIANYLGWIVVQKYGPHLSQKFRNIDFTFRRAYQGVSKDTDHWLKCFSVVEDNMDMATARVFLQTAFNQNGRDLARQVVEGVKKAFIKRLQNLDWMDAATKIKAEKKANQMIYDIAYPDYINKDTQLDNLYKDLQISQTTYFVNLVNSYKLRRKLNLELINQRVNKRQWDLPPTMVNAYYDVSNNKMGFLAGIMDYPFFNIKGPMSIRYGSFGFVAGHEITHGFDDQGRLYDSSGDLKDWWSPSSAREFRDKADCIYKQYSTYKYYGLNINANLTMGENIADNGGLKIAYQAYKEWEQKHGKELKLPGIDLNHDQLFFLAKGQLWCGIVNEQKGKEIILQDPHSPAHLRVIGTMSNSDEFQEAFNCSANAPMVRKNKCSLW